MITCYIWWDGNSLFQSRDFGQGTIQVNNKCLVVAGVLSIHMFGRTQRRYRRGSKYLRNCCRKWRWEYRMLSERCLDPVSSLQEGFGSCIPEQSVLISHLSLKVAHSAAYRTGLFKLPSTSIISDVSRSVRDQGRWNNSLTTSHFASHGKPLMNGFG
jgi:hypothetical protein